MPRAKLGATGGLPARANVLGFARADKLPVAPKLPSLALQGGMTLAMTGRPQCTEVDMFRKLLPIVALLLAAAWSPCRGQSGVVIYQEGTLLEDELAPPRPARFFVGFELELVAPDLDQHLRGTVDLGGGVIDVVELPNADLDAALGARLQLGWNLSSGVGDLSVVFRGFSTEGSEFLDPGFLDTLLEVDVLDFDFTSPPLALDSAWSLRGRIGPRLTRVHFETLAETWFVGQRASSTFRGAGGHAAVEIEAALGRSGLRVIGKLDGAALWGQVRQDFDEVFFFGPTVLVAGATLREDRFVPSLAAELGLGWDAPWSVFGLNFAVGYRFERWWNVGDAFDSRADLNIHGMFLRAQWSF